MSWWKKALSAIMLVFSGYEVAKVTNEKKEAIQFATPNVNIESHPVETKTPYWQTGLEITVITLVLIILIIYLKNYVKKQANRQI